MWGDLIFIAKTNELSLPLVSHEKVYKILHIILLYYHWKMGAINKNEVLPFIYSACLILIDNHKTGAILDWQILWKKWKYNAHHGFEAGAWLALETL